MKPYKQLTLEELKKQGYQYKSKDTIFVKTEKLDIEYITKNGSKYSDGSFWEFRETKEDGTNILVNGNESSGYQKKVTKKDDLLTTIYNYYPSGNLKNTGVIYDNYFEKGTWYWYNEKGQINRFEEYDRPYNYSWEDILIFLQKKNIKKEDFYKIRRVKIGVYSKDKPVWFVAITKERGAFNLPTLVLIYKIDGITGKILSEEEMDVTKHLD